MGDYYDSAYEIQCPACKTTKYRNPQMKLMVNVCGHAVCDSCVKMLFIKESGQCPECDIVLKRSKFRVQVFEDPLVEKEIDIRRRVMRVYNCQEEDFTSTEEWDTYLEEIEEIVYNLTNDINKLEMEKKLENYEKLHKDDIRRNYTKRSREEEELEKLCEEEKIKVIERTKLQQLEEEQERLEKQKNKRNLLEDLLAAEGDASLIVQSHAEKLRQEQLKKQELLLERHVSRKTAQASAFSSGVRIGLGGKNANGSLPNTAEQEMPKYHYEPPALPKCIATISWNDLESQGYLEHVRKAPPQSNAGGYTEHYACLRALQEFIWGHVLPAT